MNRLLVDLVLLICVCLAFLVGFYCGRAHAVDSTRVSGVLKSGEGLGVGNIEGHHMKDITMGAIDLPDLWQPTVVILRGVYTTPPAVTLLSPVAEMVGIPTSACFSVVNTSGSGTATIPVLRRSKVRGPIKVRPVSQHDSRSLVACSLDVDGKGVTVALSPDHGHTWFECSAGVEDSSVTIHQAVASFVQTLDANVVVVGLATSRGVYAGAFHFRQDKLTQTKALTALQWDGAPTRCIGISDAHAGVVRLVCDHGCALLMFSTLDGMTWTASDEFTTAVSAPITGISTPVFDENGEMHVGIVGKESAGVVHHAGNVVTEDLLKGAAVAYSTGELSVEPVLFLGELYDVFIFRGVRCGVDTDVSNSSAHFCVSSDNFHTFVGMDSSSEPMLLSQGQPNASGTPLCAVADLYGQNLRCWMFCGDNLLFTEDSGLTCVEQGLNLTTTIQSAHVEDSRDTIVLTGLDGKIRRLHVGSEYCHVRLPLSEKVAYSVAVS